MANAFNQLFAHFSARSIAEPCKLCKKKSFSLTTWIASLLEASMEYDSHTQQKSQVAVHEHTFGAAKVAGLFSRRVRWTVQKLCCGYDCCWCCRGLLSCGCGSYRSCHEGGRLDKDVVDMQPRTLRNL